ncbi:MAG TPA: proton-conducting transporter membrane subunit [Gemmatimonadales bacterium]|nr:proton-conducting transporter membrane subunit [Gemmatimonadales bacterium]
MNWVAAGVICLVSAALSVLLWRRRPGIGEGLFRFLLVLGCGLAAAPAVRVIVSGTPEPVIPYVHYGSLTFGLDRLSAWFLIVILAVGAAAGTYGTTYLTAERRHHNVPAAHGLLAVLLVALTGVVVAQSVVAFLAAWEVMAVCAYLLIMFDRDDLEVRRAGFIYLILTHLSTLALIAMFASIGALGSRSFPDISRQQGLMPAAGPFLAFALIGFGLKAGAVPLHFWLPGAHAAAPSHVSAVFSGVMIKTGIYGLFRTILLMGTPAAWWGWVLLGLGIASGLLGVLWALAQHDLKRLLAYHSVENIGIILIGMGTGVLGVAYRHPAIAVLGFAGALLHTWNHALFKSLLFLGAGAIVRATGTRAIDRLGGLARGMPLTALTFGIGAVAIVGLPPLNGFVSEWVIFSALLKSGDSHDSLRLAAVVPACLAMIGALALACFTKVTGVIFLGHPRSGEPGTGRDPAPGMVGPSLALAAVCLAIGLVPAAVVIPALRVASSLMPSGAVPSDLVPAWPTAPVSILAAVLLLLTGGVLSLRRRAGAAARIRPATWACGAMPNLARGQYTASSYAAPLLTAFQPVAGLRETRTLAEFHTHPTDPVLDDAVRPVWRAMDEAGRWIRNVQSGRIRWYLLAVVFTLLGLLLNLATGRAP